MTKILVEAGPGSGKSTTLAKSYKYMLTGQITGTTVTPEQYIIMETARKKFPNISASQAVFVCMTNAGKASLESKLPAKTPLYTYNGLGASVLCRHWRNQTPNQNRGQHILESLIGRNLRDLEWKKRKEYITVLRYIKYLKEELMQPTDQALAAIQVKYGLMDPPPENLGLVQQVMKKMMIKSGDVEWIDQVWLGLQACKTPMYEVGFVDECQDLSRLKLSLLLKACKHLFFCGDPYQSINGFAGADYNSFQTLIQISEEHLQLKTCFRCPPNHIEHANTICPARIKAFKTESIPDDVVIDSNLPAYIASKLSDPKNHLIIGRWNAQLFRIGMKLIKAGITCHIMSRSGENSIEDMLIKYIDKSSAKNLTQLIDICRQEIENASGYTFQAASQIIDTCKCVIELSESATTLTDLKKNIYNLCKNKGYSIPLATIHKSKGLEADYIYILYPSVRSDYPEMTQEQREQEKHVEFVSETRSKHKKVYVKEE